MIISGDAMTDVDLTALDRCAPRAGNVATIALWRVNNPLEFGVVITDDDGRITRFLEKPSWGEVFSDTINTGIYVLEPEIFAYMEPGKNYDFSKDIFPLLLRDGKRLGGHVISRLLGRRRQPATVPAGKLRRTHGHGAHATSTQSNRCERMDR